MDTYHKRLDGVIYNLHKKRFTNELNYLQNNSTDTDDTDIIARINHLLLIIEAMDEENKNQKADIYTNLEKYEYKKKWFRIKTIYKIKKIKEYVEDNFSEDVQDDLYNILIDLLNNTKKLNTKRAVEYDMDEEKILFMPIMEKEEILKKFM